MSRSPDCPGLFISCFSEFYFPATNSFCNASSSSHFSAAANLACLGQLAGSCIWNLLPALSKMPFNFLAEAFERSLKVRIFSACNSSAIFLPMPSILVRSSATAFSVFAETFFAFGAFSALAAFFYSSTGTALTQFST